MRVTILLGVTALLGCSSGGGGTPDGGGNHACMPVALCRAVPLDQVMTACGTSATMASPRTAGDSHSVITGCQYTGSSGVPFQTERECFVDGTAAAKTSFDSERSQMPAAGQTVEDLTGLGDAAFFRYQDALSKGDLHVRSANLVVNVTDTEGTGAAATKTCLTTIAQAILAAM